MAAAPGYRSGRPSVQKRSRRDHVDVRKDKIPERLETHHNPRLPAAVLPETLKISGDYDCVRGCKLVVMATPSFPLRAVSRGVAPYIDEDAVVVSVTKGLEQGTHLRMSQVVAQETGKNVVALTGPSHAEEVCINLPTGWLAASTDQALAEFVQDAFMADTLRVYTSPDPVGAELGAALKNIIALCAGCCDGMGFGDNTKAALMTRGLTEIARLGVAMGGRKETFAGLTGVGDLIVTCTSMHSRNRRCGHSDRAGRPGAGGHPADRRGGGGLLRRRHPARSWAKARWGWRCPSPRRPTRCSTRAQT